jgi:hypothetical protein
VALPSAFYYGYCWGLWGRQSLLLQYLFQCGCPAASEEARFPATVNVIIPSCRYENIRLLPGGRLLYVLEERWWVNSTYLLDLQTNEKITIKFPKGVFYFLTDSLIFVSAGDEYILDWRQEKIYPIRRFIDLHPDASTDGRANLRLLAEALRDAEYVFFINDNDKVIALTSDFPTSSEDSFITGWFDIPGFAPNRAEKFLGENNIVYQSIPLSFPDEAVSPDGRFMARYDGIYLVETNQKIADAYPSRLRGWIYDSHGVIYSSDGPCLFQTNFGFLDDSVCFFQVSQPVIKLEVPEEYLLP